MAKDVPTVEAGLSALFNDSGNLPTKQGKFLSTEDFVEAITAQTPEQAELTSIEAVREGLMNQLHSREAGALIRDHIINRDSQLKTLAKLGPDVILEVIASGMTPAKLSKQLAVSPAVLSLFLKSTCSPEQISHSEELLADSLIEEGREKLELADENTKAGVTKATEIAKNNLLIAKAISTKYADKKIDTQVNTQINNINGDEAQAQSWLQIMIPDKAELKPLKKVESAQKAPSKFEDNPHVTDGEFQYIPNDDES